MLHVQRFFVICVLCTALYSTTHAWDRKGRVIRTASAPMTMKYGKPEPIPGLTLRIKPTDQGQLIVAEMTDADDPARSQTRYLAYDSAGKSSETRFVEEPGADSLWEFREGKDKTRYLSLLEVKHFRIPKGPLAGYELRQMDGRLFVAKPGSKEFADSQWVGTYVEFDNLDDGK